MSNPDKDSLDMSDLDSSLPAAAAALSVEDRAGLVNALKDKLQNLAGQHTDVLETLSPIVRKRVEVLREIQSQHDELEAKFFEERAALEAKYQKLYEPLYTKRYEIVNGVVEVEGVTETPMEQGEDKLKESKGVPDFWLMAMKTNEILAEEISERDEEALKYLKDIKWCRIDNPKGLSVEGCPQLFGFSSGFLWHINNITPYSGQIRVHYYLWFDQIKHAVFHINRKQKGEEMSRDPLSLMGATTSSGDPLSSNDGRAPWKLRWKEKKSNPELVSPHRARVGYSMK
ncbi:nucleosome assembly protein 1;4-like [Olea europaea var. sylvestris]|uniref:nucleosome assembly protein 1;4-like n=1 Tax=Olea europaea var. sylvestris TaxID=158386 RepID=UPI000C1CDE6A|nr:nucleosome assembly protein 1;4-like [Olea europaea var. sylvestris]